MTIHATPPPCPSWCLDAPDRHEPGPRVHGSDVRRREHMRVVFAEPGVGWVELFRLDLVMGEDGPTSAGADLVELTSVGEDLTPAQARQLAAALVEAADLIDAEAQRS